MAKRQSNNPRLILLFSLVLLAGPLVLFPSNLGLPLGRFSLLVLGIEVVYYMLIVFFMNRSQSFGAVLTGAGLALVYRHLIGVLFAGFIFFAYRLELVNALQFGLFSYLPAVFLHIATAPFVISSIYPRKKRASRFVYGSGDEMPAEPTAGVSDAAAATAADDWTPQAAVYGAEPESESVKSENTGTVTPNKAATTPRARTYELNGFEKAVRYIGEHGAVAIAAVVDHEGLLLAKFNRGDADATEWAPLSLLLVESNRTALSRVQEVRPEKIDVLVSDRRIICSRDRFWTLMVVAERQSDDILNIRINQAMEAIGRYVDERYRDLFASTVETTTHV